MAAWSRTESENKYYINQENIEQSAPSPLSSKLIHRLVAEDRSGANGAVAQDVPPGCILGLGWMWVGPIVVTTATVDWFIVIVVTADI